MSLDPMIVLNSWPAFLEGAILTLQIATVAFLAGMVLGSLAAVGALSPFAPIRAIVWVYVAIMRGIPFIVMLFLVHYGLPSAGIRSPALVNGMVALSLFAGAYYCEIIRGCVRALPKGQWESARAIGMSPVAAARHVVIPQIISPMVPPVVNCTMTMIKESSVLSSITIAELTYQGLVVQGNTFAPFEVFIAVALIYWLITGAFAALAGWYERRLGGEDRRHRMSHIAARYLILEGPRR